MAHHQRIRRLVTDGISTFDLSLRGLTVLTEAATGAYAYTPLIAAQAGAELVLALTADSRYGTAQSVKDRTEALARSWGLAKKIDVIVDRCDLRLPSVDVVTNLGFVRPLDLPLLERLAPQCAISLMWETWEYRPEELDLSACRRLGIAVLGTNEHHASLQTLRYTGIIAAKLLLALDIEVFRSNVAVVGSGEFATDIMARLRAWQGNVTLIPTERLGPDQLPILAQADGLVVAEPTCRGALIGPNGRLKTEDLTRTNPNLAVAHICGDVDRASLTDAGHPCAPERFAKPPHMSLATDAVGPRPVIELHTAGLAVGAALARHRQAGLTAEAAEAQVLAECPLAQGFTGQPHREGMGQPQREGTAAADRAPQLPDCPLDEALCLTIDVDWAPDHVIEWVARLLVENGVKATWFVTHSSPALHALRDHPSLFEIGVHPNFLPGSTHGATEEEVLAHCQALVPDARSVRTHGLWQSTFLFQKILTGQNEIVNDVSLLTFGASQVVPYEHRYRSRSLWRLPYQWEDTFAMEVSTFPQPPLPAPGEGLKVFGFHPIHVYLNAHDLTAYGQLKQAAPDLARCDEATLATYRQGGAGMGRRFEALVADIAGSGRSQRVDDVRKIWLATEAARGQ